MRILFLQGYGYRRPINCFCIHLICYDYYMGNNYIYQFNIKSNISIYMFR